MPRDVVDTQECELTVSVCVDAAQQVEKALQEKQSIIVRAEGEVS